MSGTLFGLLVVTVVHIAWACGWLGNTGFAHAADVDEVKRLQIEEKLDDYYTTLCMDEPDPAVLELIRRLQEDYADANDGERYDPPSCNILMKLRR